MSPSSRVETQQQTRRALIAAATTEFGERGFLAATLERIAETAGYTRGAIYKNFADKFDLFQAVLTEWLTTRTQSLGNELAATPDGPPQLDVLQRWFDEYLVPQALAVAYTEYSAAAATRPEVRARLAEHHRTIRAEVATLIESYCARAGITLPIPAEHFAAMVAALAVGLANQRNLEPSAVPADLYADALTYVWTGMMSGT